MISINDYPYFQPEWYHDDGTNIDYGGMPDELFSFQAFQTEEECRQWLINHDYNPGDFCIHEYCNDDIEGVTLINADGDVIPKIEDQSDEALEQMLIDEVILSAGHYANGTPEDLRIPKRPDETQDHYMDRVYDEAHIKVMDAIVYFEESNEFDFSSYGGNPDTEWYDEARDNAIPVIMKYMLGETV